MKRAFGNPNLAKFLVSKINSTKQAVGDEYNIDSLLEVPFLTAIQELFEFNDQVPPTKSYGFVREATYRLLKLKRLKTKCLLKMLEAKEATYLGLNSKSYFFWASISVIPPTEPIDLVFQKTKIRLGKKDGGLNDMLPTASPIYETQVELEINARCEWSAVKIAINTVTLVKGVANFLVNVKKPRNEITNLGIMTGKNTVNQIRMSHGVILNARKERLLPTVSFPLQHGPPTEEMLRIDESLVQQIRERLNQLESVADCIRPPLIESLQRYDRALDNGNLNSTLSGLWGSIEPICNSFSGETMINRMLKVFHSDETDYHRHVLNRCHDMRNSITHTNSRMGSPEQTVYDLMQYSERLIEFVFLNHSTFVTFTEFVSFLDSCKKKTETDLAKIQAKMDLLNQPSLLPENQMRRLGG